MAFLVALHSIGQSKSREEGTINIAGTFHTQLMLADFFFSIVVYNNLFNITYLFELKDNGFCEEGCKTRGN